MCHSIKRTLLGLLYSFLLIIVHGCEPQAQDRLSWEEFRASAYHNPEQGFYIADGDVAFHDESELLKYFEIQMAVDEAAHDDNAVASSVQSLIVTTSGSTDVIWSPVNRSNITYCISNAFGDKHSLVLSALQQAINDWQLTAAVRFVYMPSENSNCNWSSGAIRVSVVPTSIYAGTGFHAGAYYPFGQKSGILIDWTAFGDIAPKTLLGLMRHEVGHVLGFRHEHIRVEGCTSPDGFSWRPVTAYDPTSIMHYRNLCGSSGNDNVLTNLDREGAAIIYRREDIIFTFGRNFATGQDCLRQLSDASLANCYVEHDGNSATAPIQTSYVDQWLYGAGYVHRVDIVAGDWTQNISSDSRIQVFAQLLNGSLRLIWTSPALNNYDGLGSFSVPVAMTTPRIRIRHFNLDGPPSAARLRSYNVLFGYPR